MNIWGINKAGQIVKEHDKISCTDGISKWFTHVQKTKNGWHREKDYFEGEVIGRYNA